MVEHEDSYQALCNLRLVNKAISKVAAKVMFRRFTTWLVDYQTVNLDNIAKHKELRRHVKEIVFRPWIIRGPCD